MSFKKSPYEREDSEVAEDVIRKEGIEIERRPSTMRIATARAPQMGSLTNEEWTVKRRGCFSDLPVGCGNDMVLGSWWFVAGSILTMLIPAFPLISIYLTPKQKFWPTAEAYVIPLDDHAAVYALLVGCGVFFIIGSLFLVSILATDEVVASWLYFLGTIPTVPLTVIYVVYFPGMHYYQIALIFCIVASLVMLLFTYAVYPSQNKVTESRQIVAPIIHRFCCGPKSHIYKHIENDWLIICWLVVFGCLFATIASCAALIFYSYHHNRRGIFDYATGAFDCLLFFIGSIYYVAGSYPIDLSSLADQGTPDDKLEAGGGGGHQEERKRPKVAKVHSEDDNDVQMRDFPSDDSVAPEGIRELAPKTRSTPKGSLLANEPRGKVDVSKNKSDMTRKESPNRGPVSKASEGPRDVAPQEPAPAEAHTSSWCSDESAASRERVEEYRRAKSRRSKPRVEENEEDIEEEEKEQIIEKQKYYGKPTDSYVTPSSTSSLSKHSNTPKIPLNPFLPSKSKLEFSHSSDYGDYAEDCSVSTLKSDAHSNTGKVVLPKNPFSDDIRGEKRNL